MDTTTIIRVAAGVAFCYRAGHSDSASPHTGEVTRSASGGGPEGDAADGCPRFIPAPTPHIEPFCCGDATAVSSAPIAFSGRLQLAFPLRAIECR